MTVIKCKMCGGDLELIPGAGTARCEYCGSVQTVPKADDDKKLTLFGRANRLRSACEFDKAAGVYEAIVADFPEEAEAYWGLVLCRYGIEYVDDPATGRKIPTCHRSSYESVMDDSDFEQALENADPEACRVYREEAKQIEEIRKGIIAVSAKEAPYDIFICYKETAENGERTLDSVLAQDVYDALTEKGYRVFFSRITLEDKLGMEYEPYIFAALNSAKVMLAFGTTYEYYNAVWVKNEWSRFLKCMARDRNKYLIPCYKGIDAYDMPKEFAKFQAQDLGKVGAVQDLLRGIEKLIPREAVAPVAQPKATGPVIIRNVCAVGTCDYNEFWPKGNPQTVFNYDQFFVVCFNIGVAPEKLAHCPNVKLNTVITYEDGSVVVDDDLFLDWAPNYDRLAKTLYIRGMDGTVMRTGKYKAQFRVQDSAPFDCHFTVTSNQERLKWQQAAAERAARWQNAGLCRYCGGGFKGVWGKQCSICGKPKDY